ncbi:GATA transcription factor 15 isoform X1 [Manihot esculenta]|uniref:GATA-type domain-containing protein n=2 Tax=Manihot esculenta TaxID=3983 RepID=A0A2C9VBX1_MANES|nr:GATA transcription factor 15 isoform X1 [Manihot esculenta]OAY42373.1 hypothetical protein MANES_09G174900v8 [Manihot esculenta]
MMDDLWERKLLHDDEDKNIEMKKSCTDCKTTKTPLWRGGPAGPKSLCNACGIRYRKKRRAMLSLDKDKESEKKKKRSHSTTTTTTLTTTTATSASSVNNGNGLGDSLKMSLIEVGEKMMFERSSIVRKQRCQRRRRLGEEEQAAFSLMALSCGSVLA